MLTLSASVDAGSIPYESTLSSANVTLSEMQSPEFDGLVIGNGDLYGLVWDRDGELFLRMTKNDVWDARVDTSGDGPMPTVDITAGTVTGKRGASPSWAKLYPQPRCAIALRLGPVPQPVPGHLDLERAVVEVGEESAPETSLRVLKDRNVLLVKGPHPVRLEEIVAETLPPAELGQTDGVEWLRMKMPGDIDYKGMEYVVAVATRGDLKAVSLVTSWDLPDADLLKAAIVLASETVAQEEATLVARHEQGWQDFWSRSGVQLDDPELQRWWYRMVYFAGTLSRPGAAPVGFAPPLPNDTTPWHSDYHHNYNAWQFFWPLPGVNHPGLVDPWIAYNKRMIPRYKNLAMVTYGIDGVHVPISSFLHETDPAESKSVNRRQLSMLPWGLTIGLQSMTLQSMWQKYLYDQDAAYMEAKIYPYLREVARFYVNFIKLCELDEDGTIRLGPSYSPEHGPAGIFNCPFDIAYVKYAFDAMIEAGTLLDRDPELVASSQKFKSMLPGYPTAPTETGEHIVVDWLGCDVDRVPIHNITVPASPVFPADQITWFDDEATKALYRRTIESLVFRDANSHVMLNIARARLSMPNAIEKFKSWIGTRERANGLFEWSGGGHTVYWTEMVGIAGFVNELLLQSVKNKIRLFPCWPKDQDAEFTRLRAQGGFIVSAQFKDGRVTSARIESVADKQLQLLSPWDTIYVDGEQAAIDETGLVSIATKAGQTFSFTETQTD